VLKAVYQDKTSILFSGTVVTVGHARAIVVGVGSKTAMGKIRDAMSESVNVSNSVGFRV
jgi:Ca2+ transporting ATPase